MRAGDLKKRNRKKGRAPVMLSVALLCLVSALPVNASESASIEKYEVLMNAWTRDSDQTGIPGADLYDYPEFYGGAYLGDDKNLVIQVTNLDGQVKDYFGGIIDLAGVRFEEVTYSYERLEQEQERIFARTGKDELAEFGVQLASIGVNVWENCVEVGLYAPDVQTPVVEAEAWISDFEGVSYTYVNALDTPAVEEVDAPAVDGGVDAADALGSSLLDFSSSGGAGTVSAGGNGRETPQSNAFSGREAALLTAGLVCVAAVAAAVFMKYKKRG